MRLRITSKHAGLSGGTWYVGRVDGCHFEALVLTEPSQYGIDGGQVSKLYLWTGPKKKGGQEAAIFERGWELEPGDDLRPVIESLVCDLSRSGREAIPDEGTRGR